MNDCRKFYKSLIICIFSIAMILNIGLPVYAAVYTVPSDGDEADTFMLPGIPMHIRLNITVRKIKLFAVFFPIC